MDEANDAAVVRSLAINASEKPESKRPGSRDVVVEHLAELLEQPALRSKHSLVAVNQATRQIGSAAKRRCAYEPRALIAPLRG
jgi:hypothetical protein